MPLATTSRPSLPLAEDTGAGVSRDGEKAKALSTKKRPAEDAIGQPKEKVAKIDRGSSSFGGTTSVKKPLAIEAASAASKLHPSIANGGNSRPKIVSRTSATSLAPPAQPPQVIAESLPKKEPKKGSYAEIMARAKANQAQAVAVGTISHKVKEKGALTYKQELKLRKRAQQDKKLGMAREREKSQQRSADEAVRPGKVSNKGAKVRATLPAKKPRPQPTYKGTMNPESLTLKAKEKAAAQTRRRDNEYAGTDDDLDEEDEVEEDREDGFDDEESDDMEAGFSDVEEEENTAARAARKEDEEEARVEAKLKREKEERKRKMEALAKKAKPQRY